MSNLSTADKLSAARMSAIRAFPYFRVGIMRLVFRAAPGLGTLGVTKGWVVMYDPAVVDGWSVRALGTVIVHELMHLLRRHADRREHMSADHQIWNMAGDCEINDDLMTAGCEMPAGTDPCVPGRFGLADGLTTEEYYRALANGTGGKGKGKEKNQAGEGEGEGEGEDGEGQGKGNGRGKGKGKGKVMNGQCGGGAGGEPLPGEAEADAEDGRGKAEQKRIERIVAEAVRQEASKGRGTVPGSWARWAGEVLDPPRVPWQQKLARAVRQSVAYRPGAVDYRYSRISRRQSGIGYGLGRPVLPALVATQPRISVIVDTSGSMGDKELTEALTEVRGVLAAAGGDVDLCACDAEVHELRKVRSWREAAGLLKGGGGTDMRPALAALARQKTRPDVAVVLTDGMIGDPGEPPPYRVVWAIVGGNDFTCPWGEVVKVEKESQ